MAEQIDDPENYIITLSGKLAEYRDGLLDETKTVELLSKIVSLGVYLRDQVTNRRYVAGLFQQLHLLILQRQQLTTESFQQVLIDLSDVINDAGFVDAARLFRLLLE